MNSEVLEKEDVGAKTDMLRYEVILSSKCINFFFSFSQIIYQYGGIYCDTDCVR